MPNDTTMSRREPIALKRADVPAKLLGDYRSRKLRLIVAETYFVSATLGLWEDGSRTTVDAVDLNTGALLAPDFQAEAPWGKGRADVLRAGPRIPIPPGVVIRERSIFCGKDCGWRFYVHPDTAPRLLPKPGG